MQRAAAAGLTAAARVRAALTVLGHDAPAHLLDTGRLRLAHPQAPSNSSAPGPTRP